MPTNPSNPNAPTNTGGKNYHWNKLKYSHQEFLKAVIANNGHGTNAYLKSHPTVSYDSARSTAASLFAKDSIKAALKKERAIWRHYSMHLSPLNSRILTHYCPNPSQLRVQETVLSSNWMSTSKLT